MLSEECETLEGIWIGTDLTKSVASATVSDPKKNIVTAFYTKFFAGDANTSFGTCAVNTLMTRCLNMNGGDTEKTFAKYNADKQICEFTEEWYTNKCNAIGGFYENAVCHVGKK